MSHVLNRFLEALKGTSNRTRTENGAVTLRSTMSDCLDLFSTIGALRKAPSDDIEGRFLRAFIEDPDKAMKILFFARDIREGLGERRVFRIILRWLAQNEPESVRRNIGFIAEYGRFDDLLALMDTPCEQDALARIGRQFREDLAALEAAGRVSLLAKWLPSVNASDPETVALAKRVARSLGLSDRDYRKSLSALRAKIDIIENHLRERDYTFDYSKQPSKAMLKYRAAFYRNDGERYRDFLGQVSRGEAKLNTRTLMPYELVDRYIDSSASVRPMSEDEKTFLNVTWDALPDFGTDENAIAVIDTSASMYWSQKPRPAAVALSLGLYFAEHSRGYFHNHYIEFSNEAELIEVKGETFAERLRYVVSKMQCASTNIEAVFDTILEAAVVNRLPQEELPETIYIISDMEFNSCARNSSLTNFENAKAKFASFGYKLPKVVFWNVESRNLQQPVKMNEQGVALVSGCTPKLFSMVASGELDPYAYMMEVIGSERYAQIVA